MVKKRVAGFTLVEMMATLMILALLLGATTSSFRSATSRQMNQAAQMTLKKTLEHMRNEAISRGGQVSMCPSSDANSCTGNWSDGFIVFSDNNEDNFFSTADGDELLRVEQDYIPEGLQSSIANRTFHYNYMGLSSEPIEFWSCKQAAVDISLLTVSVAGAILEGKGTPKCI